LIQPRFFILSRETTNTDPRIANPGVITVSTDESSFSGERRFRAGTPPGTSSLGPGVALLVSGTVVLFSWLTLLDVRATLVDLRRASAVADLLLAATALAAILIMFPAVRSLRRTQRARRALADGDLIAARVAMAESRTFGWISLGYSVAQVLVVLAILFLIANNLAVSRTFFMLPLMASSFGLVLKAFWINVYIFMVAEAFILVWGLVVAVAQLAPGAAGKPIRLIAKTYVDVFRGLPAIITIYLIGFGIPLTGLPILKDMSQESFVILALTLSSGAYVAEIYRAGIVGIHWSQTAAARSLGLSYMQTLRFVIIPQGIRQIIPPLLNSFIGLQKDTALVNVVGAVDAFNQAMIIASNHYNLSAVTTVAVLFVIITIPQARFVERLVKRDQRRMQGGNV
jgi:polar amino acid transport system permease protein